jgi:hypothetical protein
MLGGAVIVVLMSMQHCQQRENKKKKKIKNLLTAQEMSRHLLGLFFVFLVVPRCVHVRPRYGYDIAEIENQC